VFYAANGKNYEYILGCITNFAAHNELVG